MKMLNLLPIGNFDERLLREAAPALADALHVGCRIVETRLDPQFAFHRERQQYHSSEILQALQEHANRGAWRVLGVTSVDLYIPILTFVFGEAQMGGPCAVVSFHRLMQEFYGLPPDPTLLVDRLIKEAVHEVGHTLDLTHCEDYSCAMAPSHAVEWIDLKEATLCRDCRQQALEVTGASQHS
jgi:archaemetzincin